jgi:hypothetical protein
MTLTKRQVLSFIFLLGLLFALPVVIFLAQKRQELRPHALNGQANLLMSSTNTTVNVGDQFDVVVAVQLTNTSLRISGADLTILYDKNDFSVVSITPMVTSTDPATAFTDAVYLTSGGTFDTTNNFARVSVVSRKATSLLSGGTVQVARIRFQANSAGTGGIKFPDDPSYTTLVGINVTP